MDILFLDVMGKPLWMWLAFFILVTVVLVFDLGVLHRNPHAVSLRESLGLSAFYVSLGLLFGCWVWWELGGTSAMEYFTGFVVEKSLAMDNIFVIALIFSYFGIPRELQHRVLVFGILGVVLLRGIMIGIGAAAVANFEWVLYLFAAFLVITGIKMLVSADETYDVGSNPILGFLSRHFPITDELHGDRFFVRRPVDGAGSDKAAQTALFMTPLMLALLMVEFADVIFAVDSIPAIFAITTDPFIVYTSNIFAILGLRALFFALSAMIYRFVYLKHALSIILILIGAKILVSDMFDLVHISPIWSLIATVAILAGAILLSIWTTRNEEAPGSSHRT